jgi:alkylation response protein AidB-like acyl-CoA dehydrogenase
VTGTKHVVCDAATADELAVVAKTTDGLGVFVVPRGETTVTPVRSVDPTRPWATVTIDATVGDDRALSPGSAGGGVRRGIAEAVAAVAVETVGLCDGILRIATDYAKAREQFGVPIGSFQAVKHKLADMYVALERARATTYAAVTALAEDAPEAEHMASLAKAAAGDAQELIGQDGIQLMGGIGYTWEHDMHLWVKRAKSAGAVFGTAREHRKLIAAELVR